MRKLLLLLFFSTNAFILVAQEYNYTQYTTKDGLASNTLNGAVQDKDGYLFLATSNGLSRYDGKQFVNFTVKDGLPDNEVLKVFSDSKGRIWISTFNNKLCYYYKGKIFNAKNTPLLSQINLKGVARYFFERPNELFIGSMNVAVCITTIDNTETLTILKDLNSPIIYNFRLEDNTNQNVYLVSIDTIFQYQNNQLKFVEKNAAVASMELYQYYLKNNTIVPTNIPSIKLLNYCNYCNWKPKYLNTSKGVLVVDTLTNKISETILQGVNCTNMLVDADNNIWVCTLFNGLYKICNNKVIAYKIQASNTTAKEVFCISKYKNNIIGGALNATILSVDKNKKTGFKCYNYLAQKKGVDTFNTNDVRGILNFDTNTCIIASNQNIISFNRGIPTCFYGQFPSIKGLSKFDENTIVFASGKGAYKVDKNNFTIQKQLIDERTTNVFCYNKNIYIGTLNGLIFIDKNEQTKNLGKEIPILSHRTVAITADDNNNIYIATADAGIVVMKDNKVIKIINEQTGLASNNCKSIFIKHNYIWLATDKGLNKIDLTNYVIKAKFTIEDGLVNNFINAVFVDDDSTIWIGCAEGLSSFKDKPNNTKMVCNPVMQNILLNNNSINTDTNNITFKYGDELKLSYAVISFSSAYDIVYSYKLDGLDKDWQTTTERNLQYLSLPPNDYTLQLFATNKFGAKSNIYTLHFKVLAPFYKTTWFYILSLLTIIAIGWAIIYLRFKRIQKRNEEKAKLEVQLAQMEQQALLAQMNHHFIFNCLNSIQQLLLNQDIPKANRYLILFSKLIRNTLDNSDKKYITLTEEITYLQQYLSLEELRFGNSFEYSISIANDVQANDIYIPAMLLQPFVENALRHGIRQLTQGVGKVEIGFSIEDMYLICAIKDNGIGRTAAEKMKSDMHIEYQSKGMSLTEKRINLFNNGMQHKISFEVIDLVENNVAKGTEVIVKIPIV